MVNLNQTKLCVVIAFRIKLIVNVFVLNIVSLCPKSLVSFFCKAFCDIALLKDTCKEFLKTIVEGSIMLLAIFCNSLYIETPVRSGRLKLSVRLSLIFPRVCVPF